MDSLSIGDLPKERLIVGLKQVLRGIEEGTVRCVTVASDADAFIKERVVNEAKAKNVEIKWCSTKEELGKLCKVAVPTATCAEKVSK
ncbi:MAG: ribosomal L7Ae/L30e/S12e/Gadd45 family protein [Clostridia bacterium]|nr:ribosomal L7Ae/L30e/S12e/Gadd45 family protein [Clostridia bacterium]